MLSSPYGESRLPLKDITSWFVDCHGMDYERKVTSKWIGTIIRKRLNLKTQKSHGVYVIPLSEKPKLERLYEKYGLGPKEAEESETEEPSIERRVDMGDVGDFERGYRQREHS
jgi:hypothetical protein